MSRNGHILYLPRFLLLAAVYVAVVAGYALWTMWDVQRETMQHVDSRLLVAARSLKYILARDFHDRALDADSISREEELRNRRAISEFARETEFVYLYTLVRKDGAFYFSAPTVTPEEELERESWYFYPYEDVPDAFVRAYDGEKLAFATYSDQWGEFRSVAVPQRSPGGRLYLACADYDITNLSKALAARGYEAALTAAAFILLSLPFVFDYIRSVRQYNRKLRRANAELEAQHLHLEEQVTARTHDLDEARIRAEEANRYKSEFVANMSHEIRTPMTAILGFAENLEDTGLSEDERRDAVQTIRRNGEHLLSIINDILDVSKIEAGRLIVERMVCSPCHIVSDVAAMMRIRATARGLTLDIKAEGRVPETIETDPTRLRQILINLLSNAIKFTDTGGVRLVGRLAPGPPPRMQFDVIDTGIGMDRAQTERLFGAFAQGDSSVTRRFGGTGLGLQISKRLAEILGGDVILVRSTPLGGSHFRATVATGPLEGVALLTEEELRSRAGHEQCVSPAPVIENRLDGLRVLLAEDGPDNQRLIAYLLRKAGAQVQIADNGRIAVEMVAAARAANEPFNVILMDMQMPEMDGYTATERLRASGETLPIIALTAHARSDDRKRCIDAGCNEYASKPIKRATLVNLVANASRPVARHERSKDADESM